MSVICGSDLSRPFGTYTAIVRYPTLKRWAILEHPFGMKMAKAGAIRRGPVRGPVLFIRVRRYSHLGCSIVVKASIFGTGRFSFEPFGQRICNSSRRSLVPSPMVIGNSDCDK